VEVVSSSLLKSGGPALFQRSQRIEKWGRGSKMILAREPATKIEYRLKGAQHELHIFDPCSSRTTSTNR
jgi:hypothetical protein